MAHLGIFRDVRDRHIDTAAPPASTTIAISNLARPGALIEVEAVAVVPDEAHARPSGAKTARTKIATRRSAKPIKKVAKSKARLRKRK